MKKLIIIQFFISILFMQCANIVPLEGGNKDINAPLLTSTNLKKLNFKHKEIKLTFNEYLDIENTNKNITIQPFHSTLTIKKNKKDIVIKIDSNLRENTTYVLNITNGIKDINEGNLYSYFYIFSTGNTIDTSSVKISVDANSDTKDYKFGIAKNSLDSFKKISFDYLSFVTENTAEINGLKADKIYRFYIFKDANKDDMPDEYTPIYFDTTSTNQIKLINLDIWVNENIKIIPYKNVTKLIKNNLAVYSNNFDDKAYIYKNNDSALYINSNAIDSLNSIDIGIELKQMIEDKIIAIKDRYNYTLQIPKKGIKNLKVLDYVINENENDLEINNKNKVDSIRIVFNKNDTQIIKIKNYVDINKLSDLKIIIKDRNKKFKVLIFQNKKIIVHENISQNITHLYLQPGDYEIKIYEGDSDTKTTINPENKYVPKAAKVNKKITLKANWEEEIIL